MTVEERAELEQLRQQHQASEKASEGRGDDGDLLDQLKSLPEDEAVALLLQVRSEARVHEVSSGTEPGLMPTGDWVSLCRVSSNACHDPVRTLSLRGAFLRPRGRASSLS